MEAYATNVHRMLAGSDHDNFVALLDDDAVIRVFPVSKLRDESALEHWSAGVFTLIRSVCKGFGGMMIVPAEEKLSDMGCEVCYYKPLAGN